ncbi:MAG TPA: hypothetical protein VE860_10940 [Chthoniobacterales bacterium]|nr:hypothetical protein [Chthoniobacterales bacterium]
MKKDEIDLPQRTKHLDGIASRVQSEALLPILQECNELTAIFITLINRAKRR